MILLLFSGMCFAAQAQRVNWDFPVQVLSPGKESLYRTELRLHAGPGNTTWEHRLVNRSDTVQNLVLELSNPFIRYIALHAKSSHRPASEWVTGAALPFLERPVPSRFFSFPLELQPGESLQLRLALNNGGFRDRVALSIYSANAYEALGNRRTIVLTTYLTAGIFTLVFGFIVLAVIRARIRFSFIYYFSIGLFLVATLQGLSFAYLWPQEPLLQSLSKPILLNATFLGGFRFLQRFFDSDRQWPAVDRILYVLMIGLGLFAAFALVLPMLDVEGVGYYQNLNDYWFMACIAMVAIIPPLYYRRTGIREALWFLAAYFILMSATVAGIGAGLGWWQTGPALDTWIWAGVMLLHMVVSGVILARVRQVVEQQARARRDLALEKIRLLRDLVIQEEMERERIGADLHDDAGSRFAAIKMALSQKAYRETDPEKSREMDAALKEVDRICELNRTISHRLLSVSLNQVGLEEALGEYQLRLRDKGRHVVFRYAPGSLNGLRETAGILFYRVILELVEGLYERASSFRIRIEPSDRENELLLCVEPLDEDLPEVDTGSAAFHSLRTRLSLFSLNRDEVLQFRDGALQLWLPVSVETTVQGQR